MITHKTHRLNAPPVRRKYALSVVPLIQREWYRTHRIITHTHTLEFWYYRLVSAQKCAETAAAARVSSPSRDMGPVIEAPDSAGQREIERDRERRVTKNTSL